MIIVIKDSEKIFEVKDKFSECFPLLKIEFYSKPHGKKEGTEVKHLIDENELIGAVRKNHASGNIQIFSWNTTGDVEMNFKNNFGLNIQIFRNENGKWKQSIHSDALSLAEQSELAKKTFSAKTISSQSEDAEYEL